MLNFASAWPQGLLSYSNGITSTTLLPGCRNMELCRLAPCMPTNTSASRAAAAPDGRSTNSTCRPGGRGRRAGGQNWACHACFTTHSSNG